MKGKFYKEWDAQKDLVQIFRYYAREGGLSLARRFSTQANNTFKRLADMPNMGVVYNPAHAHLGELRFFPISGFEKHLVFYRAAEGGIEIIRVLHSARDVTDILE